VLSSFAIRHFELRREKIQENNDWFGAFCSCWLATVGFGLGSYICYLVATGGHFFALGGWPKSPNNKKDALGEFANNTN
jgi:hypothetical protein